MKYYSEGDTTGNYLVHFDECGFINENGTAGISGGFFGGAVTANVTNSSVEDLEISGNEHIGGLMGVGIINAKTITLDNITATGKVVFSYSGVGGLIGITDSGSSIDGVTANKITLYPKGNLAGGITGTMKGNITNVNISNVEIIADKCQSEVGGIVGELEGTLTNSSVDKANLYAYSSNGNYGDVGGAVGCAAFTGNNIDNVEVTLL